MKICGIYKIQSKIKPERFYIGSAMNVKMRWSNHLSQLKKNKHINSRLQNHFNKYGKDDLIFIILELCFPEFLTAREQYYMDKLDPYFNICKKAESCLGVKRSQEHKDKLRDYHKGRTHTEETKQKMSEMHKGKTHKGLYVKGQAPWNKGKTGFYVSEETGRKISQANTGSKRSEESKQKMSEIRKGKPGFWKGKKLSEEHKQKISNALMGHENYHYKKQTVINNNKLIKFSSYGKKTRL